MMIFTGNAHPSLASAICQHMSVPLGGAEVFEFSNENIFVRILDPVREQDVFVVQPTCSPVNRSLVELLIMLDALKRASAARITAVIPYYAYGRSDKKDQPRVPITARLIADLVTVAGANRLLTLDLHAPQIQGFFSIPVDEMTALRLLVEHFARKQLQNVVAVAPDFGAAKRARNFAALLRVPMALIEKRRDPLSARPEMLSVIGDVAGKRAIIVDDEIDTASTVTQTARVLKAAGVAEVYACCTHAVLSGPAIERLRASEIQELVTTDTIPLPEHKRLPIIKLVSVAPLLAEAMKRIHSGGSVGALFR
ncbi:MAG: ribose-phosphate pyrophosphokinase [Chloroflexi bacterium]|nr:ribose-phosphate pyrophosphokinase [Chloroflexota bacterium]